MAGTELDRRVEIVRGFNRFYTGKIGVLNEQYLKGPFSLAQARVLFELADRLNCTASELGKDLGLDAGYLSRILRGFEQQGYLGSKPSKTDGRKRHVSLTSRGHRAFAKIDADAGAEIGAILEGLPAADQARLVESMKTIEGLLDRRSSPQRSFLLRTQRPGDMGWVVHRHGVLYAQEYGWDERFEALVAEIVAEFMTSFDPKRQRCWMAEMDGEVVGSVFLVKQSSTTAKLRLLLVEPRARGSGLGGRLVDECVQFARAAAYRKLTLWTNPVLHAARSLYEKAGFRLVKQEPHDRFGHDLIGQTWELKL
jgi:DNA-binding MarR family transcriptional regulator/N-acetylglutamate synthase-like GNAT family acetyltransferase